jgi:hypothetical protein
MERGMMCDEQAAELDVPWLLEHKCPVLGWGGSEDEAGSGLVWDHKKGALAEFVYGCD